MTDLDRALLRRARSERGMTVSGLARACALNWLTIDALEKGEMRDLRKLSVSALFRLADALGLDVRDLLLPREDVIGRDGPDAAGRTDQPPGTSRAEGTPDDVQTVAAVLLTGHRAVAGHELLGVLGPGWDTLRLRHAINGLNGHLEAVGMHVRRGRGDNRVLPSSARAATRAVLPYHDERRKGLPLDAYRLAYQALQGPVPMRKAARHRIAVGQLSASGVLEEAPTGHRLTAAAREAFLSDVGEPAL